MKTRWGEGVRRRYIHFFKLLYCGSITVVCIYSPPLPPTSAKPTSLPCFHPWFCPCVLYSSSWKPFSPLSPPYSPLAIVRLFLTSMSLVVFCLLFSSVECVPVKSEIIKYQQDHIVFFPNLLNCCIHTNVFLIFNVSWLVLSLLSTVT